MWPLSDVCLHIIVAVMELHMHSFEEPPGKPNCQVPGGPQFTIKSQGPHLQEMLWLMLLPKSVGGVRSEQDSMKTRALNSSQGQLACAWPTALSLCVFWGLA